MATTTATGGKVYSYLRFSTPEQSLGDSERRQLDEAAKYARENGLQLDTDLRMADRGVSGFTGEHRRKGALAVFLEQVENGKVPRGSTLLVENIDRLGREGVVKQLSQVIFRIIEKDITIQTLNPRETYSAKTLNDSVGPVFMLVGHVQRAHGESQRKSEMLSAAWRHKKELARSGTILTGQIPAWLQIIDGQFKPIPEAVKTINKIFKMKLQGMGRVSIAKKLNSSPGEWTPPKGKKRKSGGWRESYISKILMSKSVIGEYQPHKGNGTDRTPIGDPIPTYYPAIVDKDVFYAVQKTFKENRGGETGKATNLFTGIVKCAYCGGSMIFIDKGKSDKGGRYLFCDQGRRGLALPGKPDQKVCYSYHAPYGEIESAVLDNCIGIRPEQILPSAAEQASEVESLRTKLNGLDGELQNVERAIQNLMSRIEQAPSKSVGDMFMQQIGDREKERQRIQTDRSAAADALAKAERGRQSVEKWQTDLKSLRKLLAKGDAIDARLRMRAHLRNLIERVEVYAVGFKTLAHAAAKPGVAKTRDRRRGAEKTPVEHIPVTVEGDGEDLETYILEVADDATRKHKHFAEFLQWATKRRMSREGRFVRVQFKTGLRRDLVLGDSCADGRGLERDADGTRGWGVVRPNLDLLWRKFQSQKRHGVRPSSI